MDGIDLDSKFMLATSEESGPVGLTSKRTIDIALALGGITLLAPLFIICFLLIAVSPSGPVLFRHRRVGFKGKHFDCLKFRTMVTDSEQHLRDLLESNPIAAAEWDAFRKLRDDPRITAIGSILRRSGLDELPQLFNVLKGDMSIVGPRPVPDEELIRYSNFANAYLSCRPGITGLWQISRRNATTYGRRVACDAFYARKWSLSLDARILLVTIAVLLLSDTAY
jgi:exopolysaccharide production protein ExoY